MIYTIVGLVLLLAIIAYAFTVQKRNAVMSEASAYYFALIGAGVDKEIAFQSAIAMVEASPEQARQASELISVIIKNIKPTVINYQQAHKEAVEEFMSNPDFPFKFNGDKLELK